MLTCEIDGRVAIPVRALPFVTEGTFDPAELAYLFYDPESHADAEFPAPPSAFQVARNGNTSRVAATRWKRPRDKLHSLAARPTDSSERIEGLLPGVFVWRDEFKTFYDFLIRKAAHSDAKGFRPSPAGEWGWDEDAPLTAAEHSLVWEGFDTGRGATADGDGATSPRSQAISPNEAAALLKTKRTAKGVDPELNAHARKVAEEMRRETGLWPSRNAVAAQLRKELGIPVGTILRTIRKTW
jgi:hypothetical protein